MSKLLAAAGVASRRTCEKWIFAGRVSVNGTRILVPQTQVDQELDQITFDGQLLQAAEKKVYFLANKPVGYICSNVKKELGARRVLDLFAHLPYRLFTAGRLDQATSGLIIVTNDGHFAHRLMHPSHGFSKEYLVKTLEEITWEHLQILSKGARVEGQWIQPLSVKKVRKGTLKVVVAEGKKHEVRLLLAHAQLTIKELVRIRIGPLLLGSLQPGDYRELSLHEIN